MQRRKGLEHRADAQHTEQHERAEAHRHAQHMRHGAAVAVIHARGGQHEIIRPRRDGGDEEERKKRYGSQKKLRCGHASDLGGMGGFVKCVRLLMHEQNVISIERIKAGVLSCAFCMDHGM